MNGVMINAKLRQLQDVYFSAKPEDPQRVALKNSLDAAGQWVQCQRKLKKAFVRHEFNIPDEATFAILRVSKQRPDIVKAWKGTLFTTDPNMVDKKFKVKEKKGTGERTATLLRPESTMRPTSLSALCGMECLATLQNRLSLKYAKKHSSFEWLEHAGNGEPRLEHMFQLDTQLVMLQECIHV